MPNWEPVFQYENKQPPGTVKGKWCGYCISLYGSDVKYKTSSGIRGVSAVYVNPETLEVWSDYMFADKYDQSRRKPGTPITGPWVDEPEEAPAPTPAPVTAAAEPSSTVLDKVVRHWTGLIAVLPSLDDAAGDILYDQLQDLPGWTKHVPRVQLLRVRAGGLPWLVFESGLNKIILLRPDQLTAEAGKIPRSQLAHVFLVGGPTGVSYFHKATLKGHIPDDEVFGAGHGDGPGHGRTVKQVLQRLLQAAFSGKVEAAAEPSDDNLVPELWSKFTKSLSRKNVVLTHAGKRFDFVPETPGDVWGYVLVHQLPRKYNETVHFFNIIEHKLHYDVKVGPSALPAHDKYLTVTETARLLQQPKQLLAKMLSMLELDLGAEPAQAAAEPDAPDNDLMWCDVVLKFPKLPHTKPVTISGQQYQVGVIDYGAPRPRNQHYADTLVLQHNEDRYSVSVVNGDLCLFYIGASGASDMVEIARVEDFHRNHKNVPSMLSVVFKAVEKKAAKVATRAQAAVEPELSAEKLIEDAELAWRTAKTVQFGDVVIRMYFTGRGARVSLRRADTEGFVEYRVIVRNGNLELSPLMPGKRFVLGRHFESVTALEQAVTHALSNRAEAAAEPQTHSDLLWYDVVQKLPEPGRAPLRVQAHGTVFEMKQLLLRDRYQLPPKRNPANAQSVLVVVDDRDYIVSIGNGCIWITPFDQGHVVGPSIYEFDRKHVSASAKIKAVLDLVWDVHRRRHVTTAAVEPSLTALEAHEQLWSSTPIPPPQARKYTVGDVHFSMTARHEKTLLVNVSTPTSSASFSVYPLDDGHIYSMRLYVAWSEANASVLVRRNSFVDKNDYLKFLFKTLLSMVHTTKAHGAAEPETQFTRQQGVDYVQKHMHVPASIGRTNMLDIGFHFGQGVYLNFRDGNQARMDGKIGGSGDWALLIEWCGVNLFVHNQPTASVLRSAIKLAQSVSDYISKHNTDSFQQLWSHLSRYRTRYGHKTDPKNNLLAFAERSWEVRRGQAEAAAEPEVQREPDSPLPKVPALKLLLKHLPHARYDANEPMYVFELDGGVSVELESQSFLRSHVHVTWCGLTVYSQFTTANSIRTAAAIALAVSKLAEANKHESAEDMYKRLRSIRIKYTHSADPGRRLLKIMNQTWDRVRGQVQAAAEPPSQDPVDAFSDRLLARYNVYLVPHLITYMGKDGIDYDGGVDWEGKNLTRIPVKFRRVTGSFDCANNNLASLENAPVWVGGGFDCADNNLTTLTHAPEHVVGFFRCAGNLLTTLVHAPKHVGGVFYCGRNHLPESTEKPTGARGRFELGKQTPAPVHGAAEPQPGDHPAGPVLLDLWVHLEKRGGQDYDIKQRHKASMAAQPGHIVSVQLQNKHGLGMSHSITASIAGTGVKITYLRNGSWRDVHIAVIRDREDLTRKIMHAFISSLRSGEEVGDILFRAVGAAEPPEHAYKPKNVFDALEELIRRRGTGTSSKEMYTKDRTIKMSVLTSRILGGTVRFASRQSPRYMCVRESKPDTLHLDISPSPYSNFTLKISDFKTVDDLLREILRLYKQDCDLDRVQAAAEPPPGGEGSAVSVIDRLWKKLNPALRVRAGKYDIVYRTGAHDNSRGVLVDLVDGDDLVAQVAAEPVHEYIGLRSKSYVRLRLIHGSVPVPRLAVVNNITTTNSMLKFLGAVVLRHAGVQP